jgi:hypothetical protein
MPLVDAAVRRPLIEACGFCSLLFGIEPLQSVPSEQASICPLCGQSSGGVEALLSDPRARDVAVSIGRSLLRFPDDDAAAFRNIIQNAGRIPPDLEHHLLRYHQRVRRAEVLTSVGPRLERLITTARTFATTAPDPAAPSAAASDFVGESPSVASTAATAADDLSSQTILGLADEKIDDWIQTVKSVYPVPEIEAAIADAHGTNQAESRTLELLQTKWQAARTA